MTVRRSGSVSIALILLVLGAIGIGVVALSSVVLPKMFTGATTTTESRPASAVVIESAPCGPSGGGDKVEVDVGGARRQARFDGCGHTKGQRIPVLVPVNPTGEMVVRPDAGSSGSDGQPNLPQRMNWVLATLAMIAGGGYVLMLRERGHRAGALRAREHRT